MDIYEQFTSDMFVAGFDVEEYDPGWSRSGDRPAVRVDNNQELQRVIRATSVEVEWDTLGMGLIVYPKGRFNAS